MLSERGLQIIEKLIDNNRVPITSKTLALYLGVSERSVKTYIKEVTIPRYESGPYLLKISSTIPVAAEEENIFTIVTGISSPGKPKGLVIFPSHFPKNSIKPDSLKTPTATISPINVGKTFATVFNPSAAPETKSSYIFLLLLIPYIVIKSITPGIIKEDSLTKISIRNPVFFINLCIEILFENKKGKPLYRASDKEVYNLYLLNFLTFYWSVVLISVFNVFN